MPRLSLQKSGVLLERKRQEYIDSAATFRPLGDRLLVRPLPAVTSDILSVVHQSRPVRGVVVSAGPGYRQKRRYKNSKGEVYKTGETGRVIPTEVRPGDVVELGGKELGGYSFPTVVIGNVEHIICQEQDVAGIVS